jgi:NADP-dependent 3-hydroxy acid dehydrogenase YdfG
VRLRAIPKEQLTFTKGLSLYAEDIADIIHFVVSRPYHVNIADLIVLPTAQAAATILKEIFIIYFY